MDNKKQSGLKAGAQVAIAFLGLLLIGAIMFYRQRMLFSDAVYMSSYIIDGEGLVGDRYGSYITQLFPFLATKLHLSLKSVLIAYSLSFNLFFLTVGSILTFKYKDYSLAILMALYYCLFVSDTYFYTNNEAHQGMAWLFWLLGIIRHASGRIRWWLFIPSFIVLSFLSVFSHPLMLTTTVFLWVFFWIDGRKWPFSNRVSILLSLLMVLMVAGKFYSSTNANSYEGDKLHNVTHTTLPAVLGTFTSVVADSFWKDCLHNYWLIFPITLAGLWAMIKDKKYLLALLTVGGGVCFFVLISLIYDSSYDYHLRFYMESEWAPLSIFIAVPFVFYFLPKLNSRMVVICLSFIFLVRIGYMLNSLPLYNQRLATIEHGLQKMRKLGVTKAVVLKKDERLADKLLFTWGLPFESVYQSALDGDVPQLTMVEIQPDKMPERFTDKKDEFIHFFYTTTINTLNKEYFQLDSNSAYKVMSYSEVFE